jgi:hypothetical protein
MKKSSKATLSENIEKEIKVDNKLDVKEIVNLLVQHREVLANKILAELVANTSINKGTVQEKNKTKYVVESIVSTHFNDMISNLLSKSK